jgi:ribosome-associated protein
VSVSGPAGVVRSDGLAGGEHGSGIPEGELPADPVIPQAAFVAAGAADEKLGQDTVLLAMGELFGVVDAFVVTSGRNARQVRTLVEEIERRVKEGGGPSPSSVEGLRDGTWVLMDYGDFIVHVFLQETRDFYDLEHLWSSAPRVGWQAEVAG